VNDSQQDDLPAPTILAVASSCVLMRQSTTVLVQRPKADRLTGLLIFLSGETAIDRYEPLLHKFVRENADRVGRSQEEWTASPTEDIRDTFNRLEALPYRWAWCGLIAFRMRWKLIWFLGDQVCLDLADKLNRWGLPTPLPDVEKAMRHVQARQKGGVM
jgi:hypothetical protein